MLEGYAAESGFRVGGRLGHRKGKGLSCGWRPESGRFELHDQKRSTRPSGGFAMKCTKGPKSWDPCQSGLYDGAEGHGGSRDGGGPDGGV